MNSEDETQRGGPLERIVEPNKINVDCTVVVGPEDKQQELVWEYERLLKSQFIFFRIGFKDPALCWSYYSNLKFNTIESNLENNIQKINYVIFYGFNQFIKEDIFIQVKEEPETLTKRILKYQKKINLNNLQAAQLPSSKTHYFSFHFNLPYYLPLERVKITTQNENKPVFLPIFFYLTTPFVHTSTAISSRIGTDITWSKKLNEILINYTWLIQSQAVYSTLGGAYASILNAQKALDFAQRQWRIACRLNDSKKKINAAVFIGYFHINTRNWMAAKNIFNTQLERAQKLNDPLLVKVVNAARFRLKRTIENHKRLKEARIKNSKKQ